MKGVPIHLMRDDAALAPRAGLELNARHNSALRHYAGLSGTVILSVETIHNRALCPYVNRVGISHSEFQFSHVMSIIGYPATI